eukprot:CAMPEP_0185160284 /NCGR_PEP_ID=MMETSP1139-20130426/3551_1 /TAXON_ID=298111 /ORGANISM="Pavlova sp., Strain CCMP459" /LENGTH=254 /DNA_ID=CAMNT_0027725487 /DNA_START=20 /DNA_END=780 /DNA_ORIENTATION=-
MMVAVVAAFATFALAVPQPPPLSPSVAVVASPPSVDAPPPPSAAPVQCATPQDGDVAMTSYPTGTMLVFKDGAWGSVCRHYTQDSLESATIFCQQLGYEKAIEQRITDEDVSDFGINAIAVDCAYAGPQPHLQHHAHPHTPVLVHHPALHAQREHVDGRPFPPPSSPPLSPPAPPALPRFVDCHHHACRHPHCGCEASDALQVTCGGVIQPVYPTCGSAGVILTPQSALAEGAAAAAAVGHAVVPPRPRRAGRG